MEAKLRRPIRPKVFTVAEFAQAFAVSPRVVRDLIRRGEIPALRIGRSYRIPRKAAAEYLAQAMPHASRSGSRSKTAMLDDKTGFLFPPPTMH